MRLRAAGRERLEFVGRAWVSVPLVLFAAALAALAGLFASIWPELSWNERTSGTLLALVAWLTARLAAAAWTPTRFDRTRGTFTRPRIPLEARPVRVPLVELAAVQLLRESVHTGLLPFDSFELNAVLRDGRRVNVADHADLRQLRVDAHRLASFLRIPVWDRSGDEERTGPS